MRALRILTISLLATGAVGCAGLTGTNAAVFEQGMLDATWYGAYHRPFASSPAEPRPERVRPDREDEAVVAAAEPPRAPATVTEEPTPVPAAAPTRSAPPALPEASPDGTWQPELAAEYVRAVYALNETDVGPNDGSIVDIYRHCQSEGTVYHSTRPAVGDLVFFHNTWDRNDDGRNNDWYTHVGLVESVDEAGTIGVLGYVDGRVARVWMNLDHPETDTRDGGELNTRLRARTSGDPEWTQYLAGELFAGFGSLLGNRTEVMVIDDWQPGSTTVASR